MLPLILIGAALAFALSQKKGPNGSAAPNGTVPAPGALYTDCYDAGMTELDRKAVNFILTEGNEELLRASANGLAAKYPKAAKCLTDRANAAALEANTGRRRAPALPAVPPFIGSSDSTASYNWGR